MPLLDAISDPVKDEVRIYEVPGLNNPENVVLPVVHGFWNTKASYYQFSRFEEFGIPFYICLTKDEQTDYEKIYEKIRAKYAQFSTVPELHDQTPTTEAEEDDEEDAMEEVVLTHQDINHNLVTIRVQPYKPGYLYRGSSTEIEMPTNVEKPDTLYDLKEFLRPPALGRMESVAPSAMESVHHDHSTPPESDHGIGSEQTVFQVEAFQDGDTAFTDLMEDADNNGVTFSDSDVLNVDATQIISRAPSMQDSDSEEGFPPPSQIGVNASRALAPSPVLSGPDVLPPYSSLDPGLASNDEPERTIKFGDGLVCEWSDAAYKHVFYNPHHPPSWESYNTWVDPNPPVDDAPKKTTLDLDDCLDEFAREEELGEDDLWYCPRCKEHRQARKTLELWRVPDIFIIHLKRFSANRGFRDKLDNFIDFPIKDLKLTDRVGDKQWVAEERNGEELIYDLFAVDNHYGGLGGGHYTAYAQNFVDEKWYYFDGLTLLSA